MNHLGQRIARYQQKARILKGLDRSGSRFEIEQGNLADVAALALDGQRDLFWALRILVVPGQENAHLAG